MRKYITNQQALCERNLDAFVFQTGVTPIFQEQRGGRILIFLPGREDYIHECPNIDYLNGWLYGIVQAGGVQELCRRTEESNEQTAN